MGLVPLRVAIWGQFVLLNIEKGSSPQQGSENNFFVDEWLGSSSEILHSGGVDSTLNFICRREYIIECNWKVCTLYTAFEICPRSYKYPILVYLFAACLIIRNVLRKYYSTC
jgi:hypothetical protein